MSNDLEQEPRVRLTLRQRQVLTLMLEEDEDLVCEGLDAWVGDERTSVSLIMSLLRLCAVSEDTFSGDSYRIFTINETGKQLLEGLLSDGLMKVLEAQREAIRSRIAELKKGVHGDEQPE